MTVKKTTFVLLAVLFLVTLPWTGCAGLPFSPAPAPSSSGSGDIRAVDQAWNNLKKEYIDQSKLNARQASRAAIEAMLKQLNDPWTYYISPDDYKLLQNSQHGNYQGIGATVKLENNGVTIITVFPGSPAEKADIKPGDSIRAIDGQTVEGMTLEQAVLRVQGPSGTAVRLTILHSGATAPVDISVVRAAINVPSVSSQKKGDIAYIQILQFGEKTTDQLNSTVSQALSGGSKAILLDLRDNPGGFLTTVVDCAGLFLKQGDVVLTVVDSKGGKKDFKADSTGPASDIPMMVLVNQHSFSGAEVLAGALQDHKRATVVGTKTGGKGSVNRFEPLSDGSAISITIARWLTPGGKAIEGNGLTPDVTSTLTGDDLLNWALQQLQSQSAGGSTGK